jgi:hypothetical protein
LRSCLALIERRQRQGEFATLAGFTVNRDRTATAGDDAVHHRKPEPSAIVWLLLLLQRISSKMCSEFPPKPHLSCDHDPSRRRPALSQHPTDLMSSETHSQLAYFIWSICDFDLRG